MEETFTMLRWHQMKLNSSKCIFDITSKIFLDFMITRQRIEVNLEKTRAIVDMKHPTSRKEVQHLTGRIMALSRFILKSVKKYLPFFKVLQ